MFGIDDFDTFQVCAVVKKTSDTGITSNERLLVIRAGMLYYYSKVPTNFTNDVKQLHTVKDLPKCSIFTPHLRTMKIDPKSNQELIITFNTKDLKQKDQIIFRASTVEQQFNVKDKDKGKDVEWRMKFNSAQRCKQWLRYLEQLKEHYAKVDQKERQQMEMYQRFFEQFNPDKKRLNEMRRSQAFTTSQPSRSASDLSSFRTTNLNFLTSNKLAGINEVMEDDKASENEEARLQDLRRKELKKQQSPRVNMFNNPLADSQFIDTVDRNHRYNERQNQFEAVKALQQDMKQAQRQRYQQRDIKATQSRIVDQGQRQQEKSIRQEEESQQEQVNAKVKAAQLQRQQQKQRMKMIQFAKTRERQRQQRERRQQEQEERRQLQRLKEGERQRQQQQQQQEQKSEYEQQLELHQKIPTNQQTLQMTQNILADQSVSQQNDYPQQERVIPQYLSPVNYEKGIQKFNISPSPLLKTVKKPSMQRKKSIQEFHTTKYLSYIDYQSQLFMDRFEQRLEKQTQFLKYIVKLRQQVRVQFQSVINQFNTPIQKRIYNVAGKIYSSNRMTIQLAFCETKTIALYSGQQILYDQSTFQTLVDKFNIYNQLQSSIIKILKKKQHFTLRVPFCMLIEYKGVMGLATIQDYFIDSDVVQLEDASTELLAEAAIVIPEHLMHNYKLSRVFESNKYVLSVQSTYKVDFTQEQKFCLDLSRPTDTMRKHQFPSLQKTKILTDDPKQLQSEQLQNLELLLYCYNIRTLYRSGQGELEERDFFSLILSLNSQVVKLLDSSCPDRYPLKGLIIQYINSLCGVSIQLDQLMGRQDLLEGSIHSVTYRSLCQLYTFSNLEVFSLIDECEDFIDKQSGKDILKLWKIYSNGDSNLDQVYSLFRIVSFIKRGSITQGLQELDILMTNLRYTHPFKLKLYEIRLNQHNQNNNQREFIRCFYETVNYIEFTFSNHSMLTTLYCILGQFLNKHGKSQQALKLYNSVISKATNSKLLTQMQIDMSSIYLNLTNKQTVEEIISFSLNLLNKRKGMAQMKIIRFLAYLYNLCGRYQQASKYIQTATEYFQADQNTKQVVECYMLGSNIYNNNLTKQKYITTKMYTICKKDSQHLQKLSRLFESLLMKLCIRANIEIEHHKANSSKEELFLRINSRVTGNPVDYIYNIFNQIVEQKESEEISQLLQFTLN